MKRTRLGTERRISAETNRRWGVRLLLLAAACIVAAIVLQGTAGGRDSTFVGALLAILAAGAFVLLIGGLAFLLAGLVRK